MKRSLRTLAIAAALACVLAPSLARAQTCTRAQLAEAVDKTGASLRKVTTETAPQLQSRMRQLKERKGWSDADYEEQAVALISDKRLADLDQQASDLVARIDALGTPKGDDVNCATIAELEATGAELIATVRTKASYAIGKLDQALGAGSAPAAKATPKAAEPKAAEAKPEPKSEPKVALRAPDAKAEPKAAPKPDAKGPGGTVGGWATSEPTPQVSAEPPPPPQLPKGVFVDPQSEEGYTIDEIREATRGFFGQVSTGLASVIEHAFKSLGRPRAYVLGSEGGGAFLAGLRYGDGTLYLRAGGSRKIFWHGPSLGYDLGVAGSKTMFLIYGLTSEEALFRRFTGIDGSAYVVGGVGLTLLTDGKVVMAPIRSGLGLRIGANIGYVRFTPTATWNPF